MEEGLGIEEGVGLEGHLRGIDEEIGDQLMPAEALKELCGRQFRTTDPSDGIYMKWLIATYENILGKWEESQLGPRKHHQGQRQWPELAGGGGGAIWEVGGGDHKS